MRHLEKGYFSRKMTPKGVILVLNVRQLQVTKLFPFPTIF